MIQDTKVTESSGNVFVDLDIDNAEELLIKAELVRKINILISEKQITQSDVSKALGINTSEVSALALGKLDKFDSLQLYIFLNKIRSNTESTNKIKFTSKV